MSKPPNDDEWFIDYQESIIQDLQDKHYQGKPMFCDHCGRRIHFVKRGRGCFRVFIDGLIIGFFILFLIFAISFAIYYLKETQ